jgi:tRNA A-37 threonylcarbamoyl transferase component Bud32
MSAALARDSTIGGRYRLASLIGEGGMASVWRAEDETLKRSVAIKLLYVRDHRDPQATVQQFLREARIAASIQHRNVIHTVDFGTTDDGVPYMVMELLHGESLADRMDRAPRLSIEEVVRLAVMTLRGLASVHDAGIVHRDLKPQNIFLQQDNDDVYPKILDFGISRSLGASAERASAITTQQGLVVGTPHYMAPEQARGEAEIDKRADIYSMGAIVYEGITGELPFDAPTAGDLLVKIISTEAKAICDVRPDVPELISDCVVQAMAHSREHRFVDARAFGRALQSAADRVFPAQVARGRSELPASAVKRAISAPIRGNLEEALPAWGDFEGLAERGAQARGAGASQPPPARPVSKSPAPPLRAADMPARRPGNAQSVPPVAASPRRLLSVPPLAAQPANDLDAYTQDDGPMLGDSPLDAFGTLNAVELELDVDVRGGAHARDAAAHAPAPLTSKRRSAAEPFDVSRQSPRPGARSKPLGSLWILPALMFIVLVLLLLAPGLFSAPAPDDDAARQREQQHPATRASQRLLQPAHPVDLAKQPPAVRELL